MLIRIISHYSTHTYLSCDLAHAQALADSGSYRYIERITAKARTWHALESAPSVRLICPRPSRS